MNNYAERIIAVSIINSVPSDNKCFHDQFSWLTRTHWT